MPEEEKLEYLKREEVKTMVKDVTLLREREAQKERERIAAISPEGKKPEEKEEKITEIKEERPEIPAIPELPRKSLLTKKILIRGIILLFFLSFLGFLTWSFFLKKPAKEELPPEEVSPVIEEKKPEIIIPTPLISINTTETAEIMDSSEIPVLLPSFLEKTFETGHIRILFKNMKENKVVGLKDFFEVFEIKAPEELLEKLDDDFTLFIYSGEKDNRLGFVAKTAEEENVTNLMLSWETTIEKDTEKLFEVLGKEKTDTFLSFKKATYKNIPFRYISFPSENFGICWAMVENKLLFSTSGESMIKSIDKLITQ